MLIVYSGNAKSDFGKIIVMFFGVFIFMYLGLEHSIANTVFFCTVFFYNIFHPGVLTVNINIFIMMLQVFIVLIGNYVGGGILIGVYYSFLNKDIDLH